MNVASAAGWEQTGVFDRHSCKVSVVVAEPDPHAEPSEP